MNPNAWLSRIAPRLNHLWRGSWKGGTVEPGRYLYDHELVMVTKGACQVRTDRGHHELTTGTFLIIPPGAYHATIAHRSGVHRVCFHFDWMPVRTKTKTLPLWIYHPNRAQARDIKSAPDFIAKGTLNGSFAVGGSCSLLIQTLFHRWQTGSEQERATSHALLMELMIGLLWRKSPKRRPADRATQLAYTIKELLDSTPPGTIAIQPLLASLGFSYEHLCRLFKAKFGVSPVRYRNASRIEGAKNLLRDPRRTISEVAYAAGFSDPAYFSRKFQQRYGVPPSRARVS